MDSQKNTHREHRRRRRTAAVPVEMLQQKIAHSMAQIILNMMNGGYQMRCMELLQIGHVLEAEGKIFVLLQSIDKQKEEVRMNKRLGKATKREDCS